MHNGQQRQTSHDGAKERAPPLEQSWQTEMLGGGDSGDSQRQVASISDRSSLETVILVLGMTARSMLTSYMEHAVLDDD